jgi:hypothetical protein
MEWAAATAATKRSPGGVRISAQACSTWILAGGLVLYLALDGGGYDLVVRSQASIVVWWLVIVGAAWGLLPTGRLTTAAWSVLALFSAFVVWTALASTWSLSTERSLDEVSRAAAYLGVLLLAVTMHRERESAVRNTVGAIAVAVVVVCAVAVLSRLRPDMFSASQTTASLLPGAHNRLAWPLNYWNALAALVALGLPLLLCIATSARNLAVQAVAAGAIPLTALCAYLTFSRGGAIAAAAGMIVVIALAPERIPKLVTLLLCAAGSAALIAGAVHRHAIEQGMANAAARHEGATLLAGILLVCAGVAVAQAGIGLAARHGTLPQWLQISPRQAWMLLAGAVTVAVVVAVVAGAPSRLSHAWRDFKRPPPAALSQNAIARFGVTSGNHRYSYWKVAIDSLHGHVLQGSGPGTYQLLWLPRAPFYNYVRNAHSLYIETLAEVGAVGLALLLGSFVLMIGTAVRRARHGSPALRMQTAGVAAASVAFAVSAAFDWIWQVPVVPVAMLLLAACVLAPLKPAPIAAGQRGTARAFRAVMVVAGLASLLAIGVSMATTQAVRQSQAAASAGNTSAALADAQRAVRLEPGAESPRLQEALVLELRGDLPDAVTAVRQATANESTNWQPWLVLSRLDAETGHPLEALAAYRQARALNPRSPVFHS